MYCFNDTFIDLTYDRKLKNSTIENEFLEKRLNFKYKSVCIISGANATGKTTFGRALCSIQNFLRTSELTTDMRTAICNKDKLAEFMVEFVTTPDYRLHRMYVTYNSDVVVAKTYINAKIGINDSCKQVRVKLDKILADKKSFNGSKYLNFDSKNDSEKNLISSIFAFSKIKFQESGWAYLFSENHNYSAKISYLSAKLMSAILKTFDPDIKTVSEIVDNSNKNQKDGFIIKFNNGDSVLIDKNGGVTGKERLSRGTFDAIQLSEFIARVIVDRNENIYFLDEALAYSHTEVEQSILNLIIDKLSPNSQFFYTTHNYDILDMNLPIHSFVFFKKVEYTSIIMPEIEFKKNDRTLLNYVKNDVFGTLPNLNGIDKILLAS